MEAAARRDVVGAGRFPVQLERVVGAALGAGKEPDLVAQDFHAERTNQLQVVDSTYVPRPRPQPLPGQPALR